MSKWFIVERNEWAEPTGIRPTRVDLTIPVHLAARMTVEDGLCATVRVLASAG